MVVKYTQLQKMGSGGFGEVWSTRRESDGSLVAQKLLLATDQDAIERFVREVRILSSLDHPNIVRIVDKALNETPPYYVMPLYRHSLRAELPSIIGDDRRIQVVFKGILDAVEYAHSQGVIHRDLKPENVLMNSDSDLVLSDFGLGRQIDAESTRKTATGDSMGTVLYMAPEQFIDAKRADHRADVYSLGRMLYELYTGPLLSTVQDTSQLPSGVRLLVNRCTQQDPSRRFQSVSELKTAWVLLADASSLLSELAELKNLTAEVSAATTLNQQDVARVFELLARHADNSDLLHDTFMQLPAEVVALGEKIDPDVPSLVTRFAEFTGSSSYAFEYTDRIARVCRAIHGAIGDPESRAALIECVLKVGLFHNRWFVLGVFGDLISAPLSREEELALVARFSALSDDEKKYAAPYLKVPASAVIARLFAHQA